MPRSRYGYRLDYDPGTSSGDGVDLLSGLVSYWKLDEATGATRADSVADNDLADPAVGDVTQAAGKIVSAAGFSGAAGNFLTDLLPAGLPTGALTIQAWIFLADAEGLVSVLARHGITGVTLMWALNYTGVAARFQVSSEGLAYDGSVQAGGVLSSAWAHVIVWHDPTSDVIGIQVDGGTPVTSAHATGLSGFAAVLEVGGSADAGFRMDELGIWSRVLSSSERAALYNSGAGLAYPFS